VVYHLITMIHPYSGEANSNSTVPTRSTTMKPSKGKSRVKQETQETIDQFPTQTQTQTQEESSTSTSKTKRKLEEMNIDMENDDSEDDEDYSVHSHTAKGYEEHRGRGKEKYAVRPAGYSWDDYRKTHGQGTVGSGETVEMKAASRALEDIKWFTVCLMPASITS
jgi:hypothetical protein